jgi:hypothetical protein
MAGTADNWVTTNVAIGPGKMYAELAIPGAGGRLILSSDGTPDSTQNPSAVHIGMTEEGTAWSVKPTVQTFNADEFQDPIITRITGNEIALTGSLLQVMDMAIADILLQNATRSDLSGTQGVSIGTVQITQYTSVAVVFPIEGSSGPTVYGVFHLYKAFNDQGLAAQITSKKLSSTPFAFRGLAITTRAAGDTTGRFFKQLAGAAS